MNSVLFRGVIENFTVTLGSGMAVLDLKDYATEKIRPVFCDARRMERLLDDIYGDKYKGKEIYWSEKKEIYGGFRVIDWLCPVEQISPSEVAEIVLAETTKNMKGYTT